MHNKKIIISNLSYKTITPGPGKTFTAFNVYQIIGNDGITYETTDKDFYASLSLGQEIDLTYEVQSKKGNTGRVFTSYKIVVPKEAKAPQRDQQDLSEIMERLDLLEKNVISAVRLMAGSPKIDRPIEKIEPEEAPEQLSLFDEEESTEDVNY